MHENKKLAFFLPNVFTALNMACGFAGIMLSIQGEFYKACLALFLGALFDMVDGRVARMMGTASAFGEQFDSMSDLLSFGMAPSLIFYFRFLSFSGRAGYILSFLFILCGALRLARFNANIDKVDSNYFQGIPIPSAALALVGYILFSTQFPDILNYPIISLVYIFFYSIMMVTTIPFPSFKKSEWVKKHRKQVLLLIFAILISVFIYEEVMILGWMSIYVLGSIVYFLMNRKKFKGLAIEKAEGTENS